MPDKEFMVRNPRTKLTTTIHGKNLKEAIARAGLNPQMWYKVQPALKTTQEPEED